MEQIFFMARNQLNRFTILLYIYSFRFSFLFYIIFYSSKDFFFIYEINFRRSVDLGKTNVRLLKRLKYGKLHITLINHESTETRKNQNV